MRHHNSPPIEIWFWCGLLSIMLAPLTAPAQLPLPRLDAVFPPGGQAGTTVSVALDGEFLDEPSELRFSTPGIESKAVTQVVIGEDVAPGTYEARFVGRFGVSNPRTFVVSSLPESSEEESHHQPDEATPLPLDTVVNGRSDANQIDYFKFSADKGTYLTLSCGAADIDSRMEASFFLTDAQGKELLRSRTGKPMSFRVPAQGDYLVGVHDFLFRGGPEYFYRLTVGRQPHIQYAFPPVAMPGHKQSVTLFGYNLPGAEPAANAADSNLQQRSVEIEMPASPPTSLPDPRGPASAPLDGIWYRLQTPEGVSNPVFIGSASAPVMAEVEPNNQPDLSQALTLPCEVVGRFFPAQDVDCFSFTATSGDVYWIEVISHRLGLPTHPFLLLQQLHEESARDVKELYDSDQNLGGLEFDTSSRDLSWRFEVKETGLYRVQIRDLFNQSVDDPSRIYRLSLRREQPDFRLVALPVAMAPRPKDKKLALVPTSVARRGETIPIRVVAFRQDQFNEPIRLRVTQLPAGVSCPEVVLRTDQTEALLLLTVETNAPAWTGSIGIVGAAQQDGEKLEHHARFGTVTWAVPDANNEAVQARLMSDLLFSVNAHEIAPIDLRAEATLETSVAGKVQVPIEVVRHGEFNETLKIKPYGLKLFDKAKEQDLEAKAETGTYELDLAQLKLEPGTYQFYFQTETKGKYRDNPEAAAAAEAASKEKEKQLEETKQLAEDAKKRVEQAVQAAQEAEKRVQELKEAATHAEAEAELATAAVAQAETERKNAADRAKAAQEKAKPRDVTIPVYSTPVTLRVEAAPIRVSVEPTHEATPGASSQLLVRIERLYGFTDPVELSVRFPDKANGVSVEPITLSKEEGSGTLALSAAVESAPGQYPIVLEAKLKLNGQELRVEKKLTLEIVSPTTPETAPSDQQ